MSQRRLSSGFSLAADDGASEVTDQPLYVETLETLPEITTWAVAAQAEFRQVRRHDFDTSLRGVLHHDGATLRFTTLGPVERFVASPIEFDWSVQDRVLTFEGLHRGTFFDFAPLDRFVSQPPDCAAQAQDAKGDPFFGLIAWLESWW